MFNINNTFFFFYFSAVIHVSNPTTLQNSSVTNKDEAAAKLAPIEPNQALPLVLFREPLSDITSQPMFDVLMIPVDLIQVEVVDKRMAKGTRFRNLSDTQTFFCPKKDSVNKCLAPKDFKESEFLECAEEAIPAVNSDSENDYCGFEEDGNFHNIGYDICPMEASHEYEYEAKKISFYDFCFNNSKRNTIFTSHIISSPLLLKSHLLLWERSVNYSITLNEEFQPSTLNGIDFSTKPWNLIIHPKKPSYKLQMLVPDADMAFALWRKTTYQNFNLEWQHEKLIPLWNEINEYIRSFAHQPKIFTRDSTITMQKIKIRVHTGVININSESKDDTQMLNAWVSIITTVPPNNIIPSRGAVIFMNNFIRNEADGTSTISKETEEAINQYCQDDEEGDFCDVALQKKINRAGSHLRCCSLSEDNEKARNVFGIIPNFDIEGEIPKLRIPGVTKIKLFPLKKKLKINLH